MTDYIVEIYSKGARKPYDVFRASLPDGSRPTFTNSKECFNFRLSMVSRAKIRYASNGAIVGEKYMDINGNGRIRWFKQPKDRKDGHKWELASFRTLR